MKLPPDVQALPVDRQRIFRETYDREMARLSVGPEWEDKLIWNQGKALQAAYAAVRRNLP